MRAPQERRIVEVVESKTADSRPLVTITLTETDLAGLQNGETLATNGFGGKAVYHVKRDDRALYVVECGPGALELFRVALDGWIQQVSGAVWTMKLRGGAGTVEVHPLALGEKTSAGTTVTDKTMEIVGEPPKRK
jgi:hypothetical protein